MYVPGRLRFVLGLLAGAFAFVSAALLVSAAPGSPSTARIYPDVSGICSTTLQACITGSNNGDVINIASGIYTESLALFKPVSLIGASAASTILRAPAGLRILVVTGPITQSTEIAHLTFERATLPASFGAAIAIVAPAQPTLHDLVIQHNTVLTTNALGGGLFSNTSLTLTNVSFISNTALTGSGGGLAANNLAHIRLVNVTFDRNTAGVQGGGLYADSATISGSTFISNSLLMTGSNRFGGGAYLTGTVVLTNSSFLHNLSYEDGGGLYTGGSATDTNGLYSGNFSPAGRGAGLWVFGSLALNGSNVTGNISFDSGAGVYANGPLSMLNAMIQSNQSTGGSGAGVRAVGPSVISGTQFMYNKALNPGGGLRTSLDVTLTNTLFFSNTADDNGGGLRANADATIAGGAFISNTARHGGGALVAGTAFVNGTLFSANAATQGGDSTVLSKGGGLQASDAIVQNALFDHNTVDFGNGGGLHVDSSLLLTGTAFTFNAVLSGTQISNTGSGGGLFSDGIMTSTGNIFFNNSAHRLGGGADVDQVHSRNDEFRGNLTGVQGSGGGMFVSAKMDISGALFYTNTSNTGGGLGVNSSAAGNLLNSLFARNVVSFTDGGSAMRLLATGTVNVLHNTIVGVSQPGRPAIQMQSSTGVFAIAGNIFSDHVQGLRNSGALTSTVIEDYNIFFTVPLTTVGIISKGVHTVIADPLFLNPAADDFHLRFASPAIDAVASLGTSRDFENQPRPMGANFDIGFDEALPPKLFLPAIYK